MNKPFAITLDPGSSRANHTGSWRTQRPVYVDRLPPCNATCPAGENIQAWLFHAEAGDYRAAWEAILGDNPLPAIMGRACYHTCEGACNRAQLDEAVGIHAVERFLGDLAIREGWPAPPPGPATGKRVLVVGAGPSGLSAAYHLARLGHAVTLRDAMPRAGGMMRYGIPRYRLPRDIVDAEIQRIVDLGVTLELGVRVPDVATAMTEGGFDACFAAVGAHLAKRVDIPAPDATRILDAIGLLRRLEHADAADAPMLGRRVVVYGGGNTALDVARTARRMGAAEAVIVYRRTQAQMPAHEEELREALEEGVQMRWLSTVKELGEGELTIEKMRLGEDGKPVATGELETIAGDTLVLALGQAVDLDALRAAPGVRFTADGTVEVGPDLMTGHPGLFCGGDMVPAERTITVAVGHGKKAARHIDAYLRGRTYAPPPRHAPATADRLNAWYYSDAARVVQPQLELARRQGTFEEVHGGLDETTALFEARRCLSCGNCFECDNCFGVCPDNAVIKLGPGRRFRIDLDFCKGCGLCAKECPCGAIDMVPEDV
jgi:2-oxoacid:acceptor oxidoreductase delta subunit (pyruvate/2-ketoisovalerate family)